MLAWDRAAKDRSSKVGLIGISFVENDRLGWLYSRFGEIKLASVVLLLTDVYSHDPIAAGVVLESIWTLMSFFHLLRQRACRLLTAD